MSNLNIHLIPGGLMSVIYYNSMNNDTGDRLQRILEADISEKKIERYRSIEGLSIRLRKSNLENNIVILVINAIEEIYQICSIKKLSNNIRIILILPDRSDEIISSGFKLYPRFISYIDSDFKDVADVLNRMMMLAEKNETTA